jgi:adenylate cyclase
MLFAEEDRASIHSIRKELSRDFGVELNLREVPQSLRDNDQRLAKTLSRGSIVLGYQFLFEEGSDSEDCLLHPLPVNKLGHDKAERDSPLFIHARSVSCNLKMFSEAAAGSGFFNISPETDGILRRVPLIMEHKGKWYPSLALATLMKALGVNDVLLKTDRNGVDSLYLNQTAIPLTSTGGLLIRFRGKGRTFDYVSAADVLSDRIPGGKI